MTNCIFCKISAKQMATEILYEDDNVMAFRDIYPKAKIHLLLITKQHIQSLTDTTNQHETLLGHMLCVLPKLALAEGLSNGFRTVINTGTGGGQEINHLHFHLLGGPKLPAM